MVNPVSQVLNQIHFLVILIVVYRYTGCHVKHDSKVYRLSCYVVYRLYMLSCYMVYMYTGCQVKHDFTEINMTPRYTGCHVIWLSLFFGHSDSCQGVMFISVSQKIQVVSFSQISCAQWFFILRLYRLSCVCHVYFRFCEVIQVLRTMKISGLQALHNFIEHCSMYATYYKIENEINRYKYYCINLDNFARCAKLDPLKVEYVFRCP
jgi:hypothetical protein